MTVTCFPVNATAGAPLFTAQQTRQALSALFAKPSTRPMGAYSGRASATDLVVTVAGTTISVSPGAAIIDPGFTVNAGAYLYASDAVQTLTQNAPHATLPRTDIVFVTINDTDVDGSGSRAPTLGYLAGVAAAPPAAPAVPARSLLLANLGVPASGGGATSVVPNSISSALRGGIMPIPNSNWYPASPSDGQPVYRQDLNRVETFNGATWDVIGPPPVSAPLGLLYSAVPGASVNCAAAEVALTSFPITVATATRRIKITLNALVSVSAAGDLFAIKARLGTLTGTVLASGQNNFGVVGGGGASIISTTGVVPVGVIPAGVSTIVITGQRVAGGGTDVVFPGTGTNFIVEDVGG